MTTTIRYIDGQPVTLSQAAILTAPQQVTTLRSAARKLHDRGWIEIHEDTKEYDKAAKNYVTRVRYTLTGAGETVREQLKASE